MKGKSNGQSIRVNGEWKAGSGNMGNYTVYVNPYLVLRSGGYTKHYYIEGQRIVSKLGSGLNNKGKGPLKAGSEKVNYSKKQQDSREGIVKNLKWLGQDGQLLTAGNSGKTPPGQLKKIKGGSGDGKGKNKGEGSEKFQYYYHADHLGSTSYITDASGEVYQHLEYFAFGETFVEEHSNRKHTPYKFNGKELDEETGLYYYGARYYDARTSVWLSVDPHASSYPSWSPYSAMMDNPINMIDPDGRDVIPVVFTNYKISAYGRKWSNLGHAGVLLIDNKTGYTKYYEYGRYESNQGEVRNYAVPNVVMGEDGKPTVESLNKVMERISEVSGQGGPIEGAYIKSDEFDKMNEYAKSKMAENDNPDREPYDLFDNNCGTFGCDVANQDKQVKEDAPTIIDPRPNSIIEEYRDQYDNVDYTPKQGTTVTPLEE